MNDGILGGDERKARRTRTKLPFFKEGFAMVDSLTRSKRKAIDPTKARKALEDGKSGLCFVQVVYNPQDQLSKTKRLDGAYELTSG